MYQRYINALRKLEQIENLRSLPGLVPSHCINLSSNDYLGLNEDKQLKDEFVTDILTKDTRFSAASSRLLTGNSDEYGLLENSMSRAFNREACLIYNSGYHANIGILSCLAGKRDILIADKMVHASILDGMQISKAEIMRYNHLDFEHLERLLQKNRGNYEHAFIVTESIFSMDGDRVDLHRLIELKKKYNCYVYLDEAHAFGVYGPNGLGCAEESGCISECDFIVGTFGKAMASTGAFVICDQIVKQYLVNHSRSLIFTTALPPVNLAWTKFLFERLPSFEGKRKHLVDLSKKFSHSMGQAYTSHIIPYITGSNENAIKASKNLQNEGIYVMPIRYPTVPEGKARLRFSMNANIAFSQLKIIPKILELHETALDK